MATREDAQPQPRSTGSSPRLTAVPDVIGTLGYRTAAVDTVDCQSFMFGLVDMITLSVVGVEKSVCYRTAIHLVDSSCTREHLGVRAVYYVGGVGLGFGRTVLYSNRKTTFSFAGFP